MCLWPDPDSLLFQIEKLWIKVVVINLSHELRAGE
jgi:hypothetical protein